MLSWPGREAESAVSIDVALTNLSTIAAALADAGGTVVLEPVSGFADDYPLKTAADAVRVLDLCDGAVRASTGLLLDVCHLSVNGDAVERAIIEYCDRT